MNIDPPSFRKLTDRCAVFLDVIMPVFGIVSLGFLLSDAMIPVMLFSL